MSALELDERAADAVTRAQEALGLAASDHTGLDAVRRLRAAVDDALAAAGASPTAAAEHERALAELRTRYERRAEAIDGAHAAAGGLRRLTSPDTMLARAPAALCERTGFRRAILSAVRDSAMVPLAAWFADDAARADSVVEQLRAEPVRLEHPLIETEVLRRRRAILVPGVDGNARINQRLTELLGWSSYVVAPLLEGATVIGLLHADRGPGEAVEELDLEVLWEFASVLAQAHESAGLRRTLRHEREELRRFLEWLNARSLALADAPATFAIEPRMPVPAAAPEAAGPGGRDDRIVFASLLTRRELDVLRLLAEGGTTRTIADSLVLAETTVKFHVNSVLRKLRVANRAEAVARYLALMGVGANRK
jgi:DNA-binding CsgD family transcriptional regulator